MRFFYLSVLLSTLLTACGGGASDAVGNPPSIKNPEVVSGQYLSFAYFQKCINPIFLAQLPAHGGGSTAINTCAGSGCHDTTTGTGGALRLVPGAQAVNLADAANTAATVRLSDMYKNFYSAQGATVIGSTTQSRLLTKPLLMGVLHGGGLIFTSEQDPNAQLIKYWISHPMPVGQDEFSTAGNALFTPPDAATGTCNIQ